MNAAKKPARSRLYLSTARTQCERVALERDAKRRGMKNVYTSMIVA